LTANVVGYGVGLKGHSMNITPYLYFDGDCEQAFRLYEKVLGGHVAMMMHYADAPSDQPAADGLANRIMHARLEFSGRWLMGSDTPEGRFQKPQGFSIALNVDTAEYAERIFASLSDGGSVHQPLIETFFAHKFGMLSDRFGVPWLINCEKSMT